jgi:hypothetical protein
MPVNPGVELQQFLRNLPDEFLTCRGMQHRWDETKGMHITERSEDGDLVERHMECARCHTLRRDRFLLRMDRWEVHRMEVMHPTYEYSEGYLISLMGLVEHPREIVRFEQLRRSLGAREFNKMITSRTQETG